MQFHSSSFVPTPSSILEPPQALFEERLVHRPVQQIIEVPVPQIVEEARRLVGSELERQNFLGSQDASSNGDSVVPLWVMEPVFSPSHHRCFE